MKERGFEILLLVVGLIGLFVFFTLLYAGPKFIFNHILTLLK